MREKLLINDIHLGARRVAGTTPATAMLIRRYLLDKLRELLFAHTEKDVYINGDLFDAFWIEVLDALEFYLIAREWLVYTSTNGAIGASAEPQMRVGRGNHDWSKDSMKLSSFDMVCRILAAEFPDRFEAVTEPKWLDGNIYMIPHVPNQDLFDLALKKLEGDRFPDGTGGILLLHANYDNNFTIESDHSLNVPVDQAKRLVDSGWTLVFGHEHQARTALNEQVIVTGNQWPSSVADCLNNPGGVKYAHVIKANGDLEQVETWRAEGDFAEIDWAQLAGHAGGERFVRVVGNATAAEAADVLDAVSRFRRDNTNVFVVTNAVVVEGVADVGELKATAENIKSFDVMGYLLEQLEPAQQEAVKRLIAKDENRVKEAA